jgi:hypothetical protein
MITDIEVLTLIHPAAISGKNHIDFKTRKARTKFFLKYFNAIENKKL